MKTKILIAIVFGFFLSLTQPLPAAESTNSIGIVEVQLHQIDIDVAMDQYKKIDRKIEQAKLELALTNAKSPSASPSATEVQTRIQVLTAEQQRLRAEILALSDH